MPAVKPLELRTERLLLRQWRESDFIPFAQLNADPRVMEFYPRPLSVEESLLLARRLQALIAERGWGFWAVELPDAGFIGYVGLHIPASPLPFAPCVEIGWRLASAYWHQGYASEAARAALAFGFLDLQLPEIVSFTTLGNTRSEAVMRRLGMQRDELTFEHPAVPPGNDLREHCLYRLARQDFLERRRSD